MAKTSLASQAGAADTLKIYIQFDGRYADAEIQCDMLDALTNSPEERAKLIAKELEPYIEAMLLLPEAERPKLR